ncbi:hypothetical protein ACTFIV_004913 [Dictyostelium citrinum]
MNIRTIKKISNELKTLKSLYFLIPTTIILYFNNKLIYENVVSKVNGPVLDSFLRGYSKEEAIETLDNLGEDGREIYKTLYSSFLDITFPIILTLTLVSLLSLNYPLFKKEKSTSSLGIFNLLPIFYMIFDEAENYCHFQILKYYYPLSTSIDNYIFFGISSNLILFVSYKINNLKKSK